MSESINRMFLFTLSMSLKASILIIVILLVRRLLKNKLSIKLWYLVWFMVIIRLIMPDIYISRFSIYKHFQVSQIQETHFYKELNAVRQIELIDNNLKEEDILSNPQSQVVSAENKGNGIDIIDTISLIWLLGVIILLGCTAVCNGIFLIRLKKDFIITEKPITKLLEECKSHMKVSRNITLIEKKNIGVPALIGFFRPKIILPSGLVESRDLESLRYIFLHELVHLKRGDTLINWLTTAFKIIYWHNPLILYGLNKMREDVELSCDFFVLENLADENEVHRYGLTLINIASNIKKYSRITIMSSFVRDKAQVRRRITMIKFFNKRNYRISALAILVLVIIGAASLIGAKDKMRDDLAPPENKPALVDNKASVDPNPLNESVIINGDVVIYSTHSGEMYGYGRDVNDVSRELSERLSLIGIDSSYLNIDKVIHLETAYENSRNLIESKVKNYNDKIMLDLHIDLPIYQKDQIASSLEADSGIKIVLGQKNSLYGKNNEFAEALLKELSKYKDVKSQILTKKNGRYNQDLSPKALLIEVGLGRSSQEEVERYMDVLTESLSAVISK